MSIVACDDRPLYRHTAVAWQHPETGGVERQIVDRAGKVYVRALGERDWDLLELVARERIRLEEVHNVRFG